MIYVWGVVILIVVLLVYIVGTQVHTASEGKTDPLSVCTDSEGKEDPLSVGGQCNVGYFKEPWSKAVFMENMELYMPYKKDGSVLQIKNPEYGDGESCASDRVYTMVNDVAAGNSVMIRPYEYNKYFGEDPCKLRSKVLKFDYRYVK